MEAPWSRAAPVKLCTRCSKLSRDFAGLVGALTPRGGAGAAVLPPPKLSDNSGAPGAPAAPPAGGTPGAGGGGITGGPPLLIGGFVGWSWMGRAAGGSWLGSTSSCSEDRSPELNLFFFRCLLLAKYFDLWICVCFSVFMCVYEIVVVVAAVFGCVASIYIALIDFFFIYIFKYHF